MGFGQEIKDFISGWQAGDKIAGSKDDREYKQLRNRILRQKASDAEDPEMQKLSKDVLRARANRLNRGFRPVDPALAEGRRLQNKIRQKQLDLLENPQAEPNASDGAGGFTTSPSAAGKQGALDVDPEFQTSELEPEADTAGDGEDDTQTTAMASRGGMITRQGYSDGGAVEDESADDEADEADVQDATEADEDEGGALPISDTPATPARQAPNAKTVSYSPEAAHDAVKAGTQYAAKELGRDGGKEDGAVSTELSANAKKAGSRAYLKGDGAASHAEMQAVAKAIDPEGKMSESERTMASLATVYEYNLKKNNPQGADRAAASMVQYYRQVSDRYKAMSAAAAEHGDVDGAMKMALRAHANVPDGKDMKLEKMEDGKIKYSMTDVQTGKVVEQTIATPEQILEFASKGSMHTFDDLLVRSSADRSQIKKAGKTGSPTLKASDRKLVDEAITTAFDDLPEPTKTALDKDQASNIKGTAFQMQAANAGASPADALRATMEMTQVDPANPESRKFTTVGPVDGGVKFKLSNGQTMVVPDEMIPRLKAQRDANAKAAKTKLEKAKASGDRASSTMDAALDVARPAIDAVKRGAGYFQPREPAPYEKAVSAPFTLPRRQSLDEAPEGAVPNRGLGER